LGHFQPSAASQSDRGHSVRSLITVLVGLCTLVCCAVPARAAHIFNFEDVIAKAQALAKQDYQEQHKVPDWLLKISYDQWRDIRFRPEDALWRDRKLPFEVQFFHPGFLYDRTVDIAVVDADGVHAVPFSPSLFDYGKNEFASKVPQDLGFAGFRLHYPIKKKTYRDEVIVFLGATYFRAVGRDEGFGLSARGLAVDTAEPSGEEFPYFKQFWLVRPTAHANAMTLYALLDSRSVTGAYQFVVYPGEQTRVDVDCHLFMRRQVKKLGIGALTSMFFFGENSARSFDDFRPEVHDSDGLLIQHGTGEWLWRPLDNPRTLHVSQFDAPALEGFGLLQRDRDFDHYQDLETRREQRPSAWVTPRKKWADGHVELVEIPTDKDVNDNIVAYFVPNEMPTPNNPAFYSYSIYWYGTDPDRPPGARVTATRRDHPDDNVYRFIVDFDGKKLDAIPKDTVLRAVVTVAGGSDAAEILHQHVLKNPVTGGWRLMFTARTKTGDPVELRAYLDKGGDTLTETWSYAIVH
jgi:periplasmic glucans biosynthesis protein